MQDKKFVFVSVDLETLSLDPRAQVLSVGAVAFSASGVRSLAFDGCYYSILPWHDQVDRLQDKSTIWWWTQQSEAASAVLVKSKNLQDSTKKVLQEFSLYIENLKQDGQFEPIILTNGASFDIAVLKTLFADFDVPIPWSYKGELCYRTLRALLGHKVQWDKIDRGEYHNAFDDARYQAEALCQMMTPEEWHNFGLGAFR